MSPAVLSVVSAERSSLELAWRRQVALLTELSVAYHDLAAAAGGRGEEGRRTRRRQRKLAADVAEARLALANIEACLRQAELPAALCRGCRSQLSVGGGET